MALFGEFYSAKRTLPADEYGETLHLFEHLYRVIALEIHEPEETRSSHVKERTNADLESGECCRDVSTSPPYLKKLRAKGDLEISDHSFRSLTELKPEGIHLKPSASQSLLDVKFISNFMYAELELPTLSPPLDTKTLFLNMMCFELHPHTFNLGVVTSYVNLMKSLIVKSEDVKELREKQVLLGLLGSDEEIVKMYQDLNIHGADNPSIYRNVKDMVQTHCNSKTKTRIVEMIHTYFNIPWIFLTLLAAGITAIQTYYTIKKS